MTIAQKRYAALATMWLAVLLPQVVAISERSWRLDSSITYNLFPLLGLLSFTILWLHIVCGVFEKLLRTLINFDQFVQRTAQVVFISIIAHPLLLFLSYDFSLWNIIHVYGSWPIRLGITAWVLLITYDIGRLLQKKDFFARHWKKILFFSTIGIFVAFFHSLIIGGDLQGGPLRIIWLFYGVTALFATIYNFSRKPD